LFQSKKFRREIPDGVQRLEMQQRVVIPLSLILRMGKNTSNLWTSM